MTTADIVREINGRDHSQAGQGDVEQLTDFMASRFPETVRLAAKFKMQLMLRNMPPEDRARCTDFLIEMLCSSTDTWQQRNIFEGLYGVHGTAIKGRLRQVVTNCQLDKLVRMRCLITLGVLN